MAALAEAFDDIRFLAIIRYPQLSQKGHKVCVPGGLRMSCQDTQQGEEQKLPTPPERLDHL
jgi:hypothetical protein